MKVIFNSKFIEEAEGKISRDNRAFCYGDGLFETMIVHRGSCTLLPYHIKRLLKGIDMLQLQAPFTPDQLESYIWQIAAEQQEPLLRMRLQVWRRAGGLYTPEQHEADFLLTANAFERPKRNKGKVGIAKNVKLAHSAWSGLKTMSALPYVLAGLEKKERGLDDLILTDSFGHVAECISANLFWFKDGNWYTPKLESGCIAGVMRAYLLDQMRQKQIPLKEVLLPHEELMEAETLIACNVTGLYSIMQLENHTFKNGIDRLSNLIQLPEL